MANPSVKDKSEKSEYYPRLIVNRHAKWGLSLLVIVALGVVGLMLNQSLVNDISWKTFAVPICLALSAFILYPPTEEWEYRPWQAKPQRYEQHFKD